MLAERLPNALLVFNKFHIIKHLHDAVDQVRRDEAAAHRKQGVTLLKGSRYQLLKKPEKLKDKQQRQLSLLIGLNFDVSKAWLFKEEFRQFWECMSADEADRFPRNWYWEAGYSRLKPMQKFVKLLKRHETGIFA